MWNYGLSSRGLGEEIVPLFHGSFYARIGWVPGADTRRVLHLQMSKNLLYLTTFLKQFLI